VWLYVWHTRWGYELRALGRHVEPAVRELFAERANIAAEVWHLKTAYKANWGRMADVLKRFDEARARGQDPNFEQFMHKWGHFFGPDVKSLDDLLADLRGSEPQVSLEEGLAKTLAWHLELREDAVEAVEVA